MCEDTHLKEKYRTVGFAAPEQYTEEALDERTDIYAIGAVLYYMLTGVFPGGRPTANLSWNDRKLMRVINICLHREKSRRFGNVKELLFELQRLEKRKQGKNGDGPVSSLKIALAGTHHGVGVTHVAVGLTAYLEEQKISAIYEERNDSDAVHQWASWENLSVDQHGNYRIGKVKLRPMYGEAVKAAEPSAQDYAFAIQDYGIHWDRFLQEPADVQLLLKQLTNERLGEELRREKRLHLEVKKILLRRERGKNK